MSKIKFELTIDTDTGNFNVINTETGEIKSVSFKETKKSRMKKEENSEPTLILKDNKYCLNQAAVDLMGVEPDCKIDIKYEKRGGGIVAVIGTDESFGTHSGNRLTKSLTVACRGSKNNELAKYGTEFLLVPHETNDGIFILQNKNAEQVLDNTIENSDDEDIELPMDIDLQNLIDDKDATITEVDSNIFQL